jgi:hypothetical protein
MCVERCCHCADDLRVSAADDRPYHSSQITRRLLSYQSFALGA